MIRNMYPLGDFSTSQIKEMARAIQDAELDPENQMDPVRLYALRPDAAPDPLRFIRSIPPDDAAFIIPDAFAGSAGPELAAKLTLPQLEAIGTRGDVFLMAAILETLKVVAEQHPENQDVKEAFAYIRRSPAWQM